MRDSRVLPGMYDCGVGMSSGVLAKKILQKENISRKALSKPEARGAALNVLPICSNEPPNSVHP